MAIPDIAECLKDLNVNVRSEAIKGLSNLATHGQCYCSLFCSYPKPHFLLNNVKPFNELFPLSQNDSMLIMSMFAGMPSKDFPTSQPTVSVTVPSSVHILNPFCS